MSIQFVNLLAEQGYMELAGIGLPFWGFASFNLGIPTLPGPLIEANVGDIVFVTLINQSINKRISIIFPGQQYVLWSQPPEYPSLLWVSPQYDENNLMVSLTNFVEPNLPQPSYLVYCFAAIKPGIYLYENGTQPEYLTQMGLYGTVIIRPQNYNPNNPSEKTAYGPGTGSRFDIEKVLVLSEVDSLLHERLYLGESHNILDFKPDTWLINGRCYPSTTQPDNEATLPYQPFSSLITASVGQRILLRVINAGFKHYTLYFGGLPGHVIARDSYPLITPADNRSFDVAVLTFGAGQSYDIILTPTDPGEYYIYARDLNCLMNNNEFPGGMMTKLIVTP